MSAVETAISTKPRNRGLQQNSLSAAKEEMGKQYRLATIWLAEGINEYGRKYEQSRICLGSKAVPRRIQNRRSQTL